MARIGPVFQQHVLYYITTCIYFKNINFKKMFVYGTEIDKVNQER